MNLELKRLFYRPEYTIGKLYADGVYLCDTLEDVPRELKLQNETCIPLGTYRMTVNMSSRFMQMMPLLWDVPGFTGIRIHPGNTAVDTSGCILVGENKIKGQLVHSRKAFDKLMSVIGDKTNLTIKIS